MMGTNLVMLTKCVCKTVVIYSIVLMYDIIHVCLMFVMCPWSFEIILMVIVLIILKLWLLSLSFRHGIIIILLV